MFRNGTFEYQLPPGAQAEFPAGNPATDVAPRATGTVCALKEGTPL
jgi:hypothetical protein